MVCFRVKYLFPVALLSLTACARHFASDQEARDVVASCRLTVVRVYEAGGFDFYGTVIETKKIPEDEFNYKMKCVKWKFLYKRIDDQIIAVDNGPPLPVQDSGEMAMNDADFINLF